MPPSPELISVFGTRSGPRSRKGCWTCRQKKVKCDESRPVCRRCTRLALECDYTLRPRRRRSPQLNRSVVEQDDLSQDRGRDRTSEIHEQCASPSDLIGPGGCPVMNIGTPNTLPIHHLSLGLMTSRSGLELSSPDHAVIRHYRTAFSANHHTKNPQYSVFAIIFDLAESDAMIMHMILAISSRDMDYQKDHSDKASEIMIGARNHYCDAIRLMGKAVQSSHEKNTLDNIFSALWLMIIYEQKFGDAEGMAISAHLKGAASLICTNSTQLCEGPDTDSAVAQVSLCYAQRLRSLSPFTCRMIVWMAGIDACAASYGLGGYFNRALHQVSDFEPSGCPATSSARMLSTIHRQSNPLFKSFWGDNYPQSEFMDDMKNRSIFALYRESLQLRFTVAELESLQRNDESAAQSQRVVIENAITQVQQAYAEVLDTVSMLRTTDNDDRRLISNIRYIVPQFHAAVLAFHRATRISEPCTERRRIALSEIITLAFLSYRDEGYQGLFRMAWPLFMAGLETTDLVHQQWILDRFQGLEMYGRSYSQAHQLLAALTREQETTGNRASICHYLESHRSGHFFI